MFEASQMSTASSARLMQLLEPVSGSTVSPLGVPWIREAHSVDPVHGAKVFRDRECGEDTEEDSRIKTTNRTTHHASRPAPHSDAHAVRERLSLPLPTFKDGPAARRSANPSEGSESNSPRGLAASPSLS